MIHTVKGFSVVNEAEVDVFLEFSCFVYDPADVGDLIFGSSTFSKSSLYICKFSVHVLLKPRLEDFEHDLAGMWNECNCAVIWAFFGIALLWNCSENLPFQSCGHCWVFQICWHLCLTLILHTRKLSARHLVNPKARSSNSLICVFHHDHTLSQKGLSKWKAGGKGSCSTINDISLR